MDQIHWQLHFFVRDDSGLPRFAVGGNGIVNISQYMIFGIDDMSADAGTPRVDIDTGTFTDSSTVASGTQASWNLFQVETQTLAATNASVTTTDVASMYIQSAPTAGANMTITNAYALFVDDGLSRFDGNIDATGGLDINADSVALTVGAGADLSIEHDGTDTTMTSATGNLLIDNTNAIGKTQIQLGSNASITTFEILNNSGTSLFDVFGNGEVNVSKSFTAAAAPMTEAAGTERLKVFGSLYTDDSTTASGTQTHWYSSDFSAPSLAAVNSSVTTTTAATVYIEGPITASTNQTITNNYALLVDAGVSRFDGNILAPGGIDISADSSTLTFGDSLDLTIQHDGTDNLVTSSTGDLILDNTNSTGTTVCRLGTDTTATDFQVQNNSETAAFTVFGDSTAAFAGELTMGTNKITNVVDPTADQDAATKKYVDDNAGGGGSPGGADTQVQFNNSSAFGGISSWTTNGTTTFTGADNAILSVGTGSDWSVTHDGTDTTMTSTTGDLVLDNTNATGTTVCRLGTDTSASTNIT